MCGNTTSVLVQNSPCIPTSDAPDSAKTRCYVSHSRDHDMILVHVLTSTHLGWRSFPSQDSVLPLPMKREDPINATPLYRKGKAKCSYCRSPLGGVVGSLQLLQPSSIGIRTLHVERSRNHVCKFQAFGAWSPVGLRAASDCVEHRSPNLSKLRVEV